MEYNNLFRDDRIVDGIGSPWCRGDVAIADNRIAAAGQVGGDANKTINLDSAAITPVFIDSHTHSNFTLLANREAHSKVRQGVTLEVVGNCDTSTDPRYGAVARNVDDWFESNAFSDAVNTDIWKSMTEYLDHLVTDISLNAASLVSYDNIRATVIGYDDREPTTSELNEIRDNVAEAMEQREVGLSAGLFYPPGYYTDEVAAAVGGFYATYIRSKSDDLIESIENTLEIGHRAGIPIQVSHHKAISPDNWGKCAILSAGWNSREYNGVDIVQPVSVHRLLNQPQVPLPNRVHDGDDVALERLRNDEDRERLRDEIATNRNNSWDGILVTSVLNPDLKHAKGKTITELAAQKREDCDPADILLDIVMYDKSRMMHIYFGMDGNDIQMMMRHELTMIGSDGSSLTQEGSLGGGIPHLHNYETFPYVLGHYAHNKEVISFKSYLHKITILPASRQGLADRGTIKASTKADITIFAPETVAQAGDFLDSNNYPNGILHILVTGEFVVRDDDHTGAHPGEVVKV